MRDNINKVAERGERLDSLESKTGILSSELTTHVRQPRSLSSGIPTWSKSRPKTNVVESQSPLFILISQRLTTRI